MGRETYINMAHPAEMTEIFTNLEKEGRADVGNLVKWMQDSKLIEASKEEEDKALAMFNDVRDKNHVKVDEFKGVITKLAADKAKTFEDFSKQLADEGPSLMRAATEGISAFKDAFSRK